MSLTDSQQAVLDAIRENPGCTVRELSKGEDIPIGTITNCLITLRERGLVMPSFERGSPNYGLLFPVENQCPDTAVDASLESGPLTSDSSGAKIESPTSNLPTGGIEIAPVTSVDPGTPESEPSGSPMGVEIPTGAASPVGASDAPTFPSDLPPFMYGGGCILCDERPATVTNADDTHLTFCGECVSLAVDPAKPGSEFTAETLVIQAPEPGHHPVVEPTPGDMILVSRGEHVAGLGAAKELAEENAALRAHLARVTDERDMYRHSHNAAAQQHSRLCKAFGLESADPDVLEQMVLAAIGIQRELENEAAQQRKRADDAEKAEAATHRRLIAHLRVARAQRNALESQLAEISWLCTAVGFDGSGDTMDQFEWLLEHVGQQRLTNALRSRRRLRAEILERETALSDLVAWVRAGLPPETADRCSCGGEARKVEGEAGFTECDDCFYRDPAVDPGEGAE